MSISVCSFHIAGTFLYNGGEAYVGYKDVPLVSGTLHLIQDRTCERNSVVSDTAQGSRSHPSFIVITKF